MARPDRPRGDKGPNWHSLAYHSGWQGHRPEQPAEGIPAFFHLSRRLFFVSLRTRQYAPNHQVTLRNARDGWEADIFGAYYTDENGQGGQWVFAFDPKRYPKSFDLRFVLNRMYPMRGPDLTVKPKAGTAIHFDESEVLFPVTGPRYSHPYDNLITTTTKLQQDAVPGNLDESVLYDVIIIGSGMGGGVLADALTDRHGKRVLVLEAGSLLFHTQIDNLPGYVDNLGTAWNHQIQNYVNLPGSTLMFGVQMNLGGRSVFWEGLIPRMHRWEMDYWPSSIGTYLRSSNGYRRAEGLLRKCRTLGVYQDRVVRDLRSFFPELSVKDLPRSVHQPNIRRRPSRRRWSINEVTETSTGLFSTSDLLLDSLAFGRAAGDTRLNVNLNHLVTAIETVGSKAVSVVCQDLVGGVQRKYLGNAVVLAAGSLESPRIAMASGLADPSGLIGVGLTDHPSFFPSIGYTLPPTSPYSGADHHAKILMWHKDIAGHPYNIELLINPQYWSSRHADDDVRRQMVNTGGQTWVAIKFNMGSELDDRNQLTFVGPNQKLNVMHHPNLSGFHLQSEVIDVRNQILEFLEADFDPTSGIDYAGDGTVHHAGGSLRMSDDHSGVVDENLKFESYSNLYCCDVSVFPYIPTANPSLTLVALAQRLADHLAGA